MNIKKSNLPRSHFGLALGIAAATIFAIGPAALADDKQALIDSALSAAPSHIAETAKVMTMKGEVLKEGSGSWTCFPYEGAGTSPMCLDPECMRWADAWMNKKDFQATKVAFGYMLAGDMPDAGASNIDPFATAETPDNQWIVEGPHVMSGCGASDCMVLAEFSRGECASFSLDAAKATAEPFVSVSTDASAVMDLARQSCAAGGGQDCKASPAICN